MTEAPIRVLHSLAPPDGTTKYVDQMTVGAPADVSVHYFSWKRALRGHYDVLHVHWPELLLRGRSARMRLAKRQAMRATLMLARARRIPLVRTVHNLHPHESGGPAEQKLLNTVDKNTDVFIRLNPTTELEPGMSAVTILHGHYRDRFSHHPHPPREPGLMLYFGIIRPYKNVEKLIAAYAQRRRPATRLRVVGSPSPELRATISELVDKHDGLTARLAFVDDAELVAEICAASLVVLAYAEMHNSGAALVALSLDRPILVPRTPSNSALAEEVGPEWVIQFDGEITNDILGKAVEATSRIDPTSRPRLDGRDWDEIGRRHRDVYRSVIAAKAKR